ncbi:MAG: hypothetical protein R8F63_17730 [Acidimicrobiales bacterium]|nr:hypothetical protein [Acidimicrobiales bacterium]
MRVRHVIPTVGPSAPADLVAAQEMTLRSVERAVRCADPSLDVDVRAVHFPDEPVDAPWLTDMPILDRSILDLGEFVRPRRLPLLPDVLAGFGDPDDYDVAVLTNVDIAVQPLFYDLVQSITGDGYDAFSITRRTVQPAFGGSSLARLAATEGTVHPGHDCFVMSSALVARMDPGDAALGVRWVGRTLLWQLQLCASRYRTFGDLHATFHIGDDRVWVDPDLADYDRYNIAVARRLVERLLEEHGRARVSRLVSVAPFLDAIDDGGEVVTRPARETTFPVGARPPAGGAQRLIFSANAGRSGSEYLAELLGSSPTADGGHEREPTMTGPWWRRTLYEDPRLSYADRRVKTDIIRGELDTMLPGRAYVDTSHMFVKTFADVVFDDFPHDLISVVVLRRDPLEVARSYFELDFCGIRSRPWIDWFGVPTAPFAAFRAEPEEITDQFDLIFSALVDFEMRTAALRAVTPAVRWVDAKLDEITTVDGAGELFDALGLRPPADLEAAVSRRVNVRSRRKSELEQPVDLGYVSDRAEDFFNRFDHREEVQLFRRLHWTAVAA